MKDQLRNLQKKDSADKTLQKEKSYIYKLEEESIPRECKLALSRKMLGKAGHFYNEKDLQTTIAYCTIALIMDPGNPKAYNIRGMLRHSNDDIEGALDDFEASLRISPDFAEAHANMALAFKDQGKLDEAFDSIDNAICLNGRSWLFYNIRGILCHEAGDLKGAIREFTIGIRTDSCIPSIYFNRGIMKKEKGDFKGALRDIKIAEYFEPKIPIFHFNLGLLYKNKNPALSMHNFNMAIELNPDFDKAYKERASLRFAKGDIGGGSSDMERHLELSMKNKAEPIFPSDYEIADAISDARFESDHYRDALNYLMAGRINDSASMMDSYVCMIRTRIESLIISKKAVHLREKKDYCNSIKVFTKAIEFDSENFALYFERGMTKTLAKDHGGAALDFTTAINMGYRTKEIYANRGNSYLALKEYRKAAEDFNSALKFEKTARLFYLKGCALYSCGNHEDAYQSFLSSLLINDRDPAIHYHLSQCRYELGDMDRALEHCEKAISLDTGRTAKYFMQRGLIKERILDYDGAINDYTSAIKLDPDNAVAYERRSEAKFAKGDIEGYFEDEQEAKKNEDQF